MRLPSELQTQICRDMNKAELKIARLVCKSLDQAAVPFLFNEVFVAASYSDLETADLVASRFGAHVKTITLSFVDYEPLPQDFLRCRKIERGARFNGHLEHAFEVYCKLQTENFEVKESGDLLAKLCIILSKSPNIRKMILTDCGSRSLDGSQLQPHDPWKPDDLCPFKVCQLSVSDHIRFYFRPCPPYQITPNPFHLAMLATSTTNSIITDFAMIHEGKKDEFSTKDTFLMDDAFIMTPQQSCCLTLQLQHLTKLRLRLSEERDEIQAQNPHPGRIVSQALSSAVNLESLFIETYSLVHALGHGTPTTMSSFLGGCRFPRLRSLILKLMNSRENELLDFLKTSPCLKHLTLDHFTLSVGSWETVAERVRSAIQLKSVMLHQLYVHVPGHYSADVYGNDHDLIENFFLHNGENSFTKAAIDLWRRQEREMKRVPNDASRQRKAIPNVSLGWLWLTTLVLPVQPWMALRVMLVCLSSNQELQLTLITTEERKRWISNARQLEIDDVTHQTRTDHKSATRILAQTQLQRFILHLLPNLV